MKRVLSLVTALMAYVGPPVWASIAIEADRKSQLGTHGWVCGTPMIGIVCLAGLTSSLLSLAATSLGMAALRAIPEPRPRMRLAELGFLFFPCVIGVGYVMLVLFA